jgi:hypothetical protein
MRRLMVVLMGLACAMDGHEFAWLAFLKLLSMMLTRK